MDTTTLNTVIGVSGVIIGALIGAYATIKSQKLKEIKTELQKNANREKLRNFIDKVDFYNLKKIWIIGHTGKEIASDLCNRIDNIIIENKRLLNCEINIIMRTPINEELYRNSQIKKSLEHIKSLKGKVDIDIRFYEKLPFIRGIICEYDEKRESYLSVYYWNKIKNNTNAYPEGVYIQDKISNEKSLVKIAMSWINHFWGQDELHTVAFDFDDTLIKSYEVQVEAWKKAITESIRTKLINYNNLSNELKSAINNKEELNELITRIFFEEQIAKKMFQKLFIGIDIDSSIFQKFDKKRFEFRKQYMKNARFIEDAKNTIINLSKNYNLVIISLTDEELIKDFLSNEGLLIYFSVILGKRNLKLTKPIDNIASKTFLIQKLSELIGIPLDRIVFIGDNDSDYMAGYQLNIDFIESKYIAKEHGKKTLIKNNKTIDYSYFTINSLSELPSKLLEISNLKKIKKFDCC